MNIAISTLVNSTVKNGLNKYIRYLIDYLQKTDSEHRFFILVNKEFDELINVWHPYFKKVLLNIPHHPRIIMRPLYFGWQNLFSKGFFRYHEINVFHIPNPIPLYYSFDVPTVVTVHDLAEYEVKRYTFFRQKMRMIATESSVKHSAHILTVSQYSKSQIEEKLEVSPDSIHVTYPGLTLMGDFSKLKSKKCRRPYFLHVGGSRPNKNIPAIIQAFYDLSVSSSIELHFVGTPVDSDLYSDNNVIFHGEVSEKKLIELYKNAFALVYPSLYEGFGLPITEAMACGTPVITSNITSMPEIGGDAVHYVNPTSISSIREGMEKLLTDEEYRQSLIHKGLRQYKKFSWEEAARKTIEVYEKAAVQN